MFSCLNKQHIHDVRFVVLMCLFLTDSTCSLFENIELPTFGISALEFCFSACESSELLALVWGNPELIAWMLGGVAVAAPSAWPCGATLGRQTRVTFNLRGRVHSRPSRVLQGFGVELRLINS